MERKQIYDENKKSGCGTIFLLIVIVFVAFYFITNGWGKNKAPINNNAVPSNTTNAVNTTNTENTNSESNTGNNADIAKHYKSYYDGSLGSCGDLKGNVVIVSVYVSDLTTSWDTASEEDRQTQEQTLKNLSTATDYLIEQAASFGSKVQFIYDWNTYPELKYSAKFRQNMLIDLGTYYPAQNDWIRENIDSQAIKDRFEADHILYMMFFDTLLTNPYNPWSYGTSTDPSLNNLDFYIEIVDMFCRFDGFTAKPSSYAHEIMHAFGARDLYYANEFIPQSYVDHLKKTKSEDIMFMVYDSEKISNVFSPLDAYYTGIGPAPADLQTWGLKPSEHSSLQ